MPQSGPDHAVRVPEAEENSDSEEDEDHDVDVDTFPDATAPSEIKAVITKVKKIVKFTRQREAATVELNRLQRAARKKSLKLIQEVPTRWNSLFLIVERYLQIAPYVDSALGTIARQKARVLDSLTRGELDLLRDLKRLLMPLSTIRPRFAPKNH